jgi:hypothetical protein
MASLVWAGRLFAEGCTRADRARGKRKKGVRALGPPCLFLLRLAVSLPPHFEANPTRGTPLRTKRRAARKVGAQGQSLAMSAASGSAAVTRFLTTFQ